MQQIKESVGLKFNLINNGTEYEVVGIGDCKDGGTSCPHSASVYHADHAR